MNTNDSLAYLPAATVGLNYKIILSADSPAKGNSAAIKAGPAVGDNIQAFWGQIVLMSDTDMNGDFTQTVQQIGPPVYNGTADRSQDFISLGANATKSGGEAGNSIDVVCLSTGLWNVNGVLTTSAAVDTDGGSVVPIGGSLNVT